MRMVQVPVMGCLLAALAVVIAPAHVRADHGCGYSNGGYSGYGQTYTSGYSGGYVYVNPSPVYNYQSVPVYSQGNVYRSHGYRQSEYSGYSQGHTGHTPSWSHSDRWDHDSHHSFGRGGYSEHGHRHHGH